MVKGTHGCLSGLSTCDGLKHADMLADCRFTCQSACATVVASVHWYGGASPFLFESSAVAKFPPFDGGGLGWGRRATRRSPATQTAARARESALARYIELNSRPQLRMPTVAQRCFRFPCEKVINPPRFRPLHSSSCSLERTAGAKSYRGCVHDRRRSCCR